jgi:type IV secretion system protein VirB6
MIPTSCAMPPVDGPFVSGALRYVDCQARLLGGSGFQALAAPGSSVGLLLDGLLTIFVALIGGRMLLGERPTIRTLVVGAIRIGLALTLATNWTSFRPLVFDVVTGWPAALAHEMTGPAGANGSLADSLQAVSDSFDLLLAPPPEDDPAPRAANPAPPTSGATASSAPNSTATPAPAAPAPQPTAQAGTILAAPLPLARMVFLVVNLGLFSALCAAAGLLLALAPLFGCLVLFDRTLPLFEEWAKTLLGIVLAITSATIIGGLEVAAIGPMLNQIAALSAAFEPIGPPTRNVLLTVLLFTGAQCGGLWAVLRATRSFGWVVTVLGAAAPIENRPAVSHPIARPATVPALTVPAGPSGRAVRIAAAMAAPDRRLHPGAGPGSTVPPTGTARPADPLALSPTPGHRRRVRSRDTLSMAHRDQR